MKSAAPFLAALIIACQAAPAASPPVPAPATPAATRGGTVVAADYEYPDTLDPLHASTLADLRVASLLFEPLWTLAPDLQPLPRLLAKVPTVANGEVSAGADGRSMTVDLKLAPGVRWSDGRPVTADDVIFTVDAICSGAVPGGDRSGFDHIASQERRSSAEVVWHFGPRPKGACGLAADLGSGLYPEYALLGPRTRLLPAHRLASLAPAAWPADPYFQHPDVVSGPFAVRDVIAGSLIDLVSNPGYAAGRRRGPLLDAITFRFYRGKEAEIAGLQSGEADLGFHLLPADRSELNGVRGSLTVVSGSLRGEFLLVNHGPSAPWAGDQPLLAALAGGLDRGALNQAAFGGEAIVTAGLFPAEMRAFSVAEAATGAAAARVALDADGWVLGPDGVRARGGHRLAFSLVTVCESYPRQLEQVEMVRQWSALGAAVTTGCQPRDRFFGSGGTVAAGAYDLALLSEDWQPDPAAWAAVAGLGHCQDQRLDAAFRAGEATLDPAQRRATYLEAAAEWLRYGCTIPLYEWPSVVQRSGRLIDFEPNSTLGLDTWNAAEWSLSV